MISRIPLALLGFLFASRGYADSIPEGFTTAVQCKCSDIEKCSSELTEKTNSCKTEPSCEAFLKRVGDSAKIRACLDDEHAHMQALENCVKQKVGGMLGCSNDEKPKNLTIPLIPLIETPELPTDPSDNSTSEAPATQAPGQGPPELAHYLMCVDQCAMNDDVPIPRRRKRSPVNCAFKLKCALSPPDESVQRAFGECEKELKIDPRQRFLNSCNCLKAAGVSINCDLP